MDGQEIPRGSVARPAPHDRSRVRQDAHVSGQFVVFAGLLKPL
ncbi:MAG: hypothetical protein ACJA0P_002906 [Planctomycetota bacterium]|jgi:hypothetical protein